MSRITEGIENRIVYTCVLGGGDGMKRATGEALVRIINRIRMCVCVCVCLCV